MVPKPCKRLYRHRYAFVYQIPHSNLYHALYAFMRLYTVLQRLDKPFKAVRVLYKPCQALCILPERQE